MTPTPEQVIQALNSIQLPRNHAQLIFQAISNDKTGARPASSCPVAGHHNSKEVCYGWKQV